MPLAKTIIEVPLGVGVQTKADPKVVQPGSLLVLENGEFDESGAVSKRNGYTPLAKTTMSGSTISAVRAILAYKNATVLLDGESLYLRSPTVGKWLAAGTLKTVSTIADNLPMVGYNGVLGDRPIGTQLGIANGLAVYAYRQQDNIARAGVVDVATGRIIVQPTTLEQAGDIVRVAVSGNYVGILVGASELNFYYYDTANPGTTFTNSITVDTHASVGKVLGTNGLYDIAGMGSGTFVCAFEDNTPNVIVVKFDFDGSDVSTATIATDPGGKHIGVAVSAANDVYVAYRNDATNRPRCAGFTSSLSVLFAGADMSTTAGTDQYAGFEESTNVIRWVYSISASSQRRVTTQTVTSAGSFGSETTVTRGTFVASKPFAYGGTTYVAVGYTSGNATGVQSGYYLVTSGGHVAAQWLPGSGYVEDEFATILPAPAFMATVSTGVYWIGCGLRSVAGAVVEDKFMSPAVAKLDFFARPTAAELGDNLCIATGGLLYEFDGGAVYENNFLTYPEPVTGTQGAGGSLANGAYQFSVCYAYFDSKGQLHLGTPSPAITVTVAAGGGTATVVLTVPTLRLTNRTGVYVLAYATDVNGTVFYEAVSAANVTTSDTLTMTFTTVTGLTDNRILYTVGGIIENSAPPALASIVRKGNRLYAIADKGVVYYTKNHVEGEPPCFVAETLVRDLFEDGGSAYGLAEMDGKLIALGERSIQAFAGEGLNDTGTLDTLTEPQQIATDVGMVAGSPLVTAPDGVFFKSAKGICLIDRSLGVQFVGAPVDTYASLDTVSAVLVPDKNQIRFGHTDGVCLVYDYLARQWSVVTAHEQASAIYVDGAYHYATAAGQVLQQSEGFLDNSTAIGVVIESPWIKLAALQGFQRLYYASLIGEWRSDHTLTLKIYYDYNPDAAETVTLAATSAAQGYSPGDPLQVRHHMGRKCQAVKFRIEDSDQAGTKESFTLTALSLEIGGKGGVFRQQSSKTV